MNADLISSVDNSSNSSIVSITYVTVRARTGEKTANG